MPHPVQLDKVSHLFPLVQQLLGSHLAELLALDLPRQIQAHDWFQFVLFAHGHLPQHQPEQGRFRFAVVILNPIDLRLHQIAVHVKVRIGRFVVDEANFLVVSVQFAVDGRHHLGDIVLRGDLFAVVILMGRGIIQ